jgi:molybdopterin synthase sulfurtransferase
MVPPLFRRNLVRWQQLATPAWLAGLPSGELVEATPSDDWRLFEVGFGSSDVFLQGHIPGAGHIDTNQLEQEPLWNKVSDQALLQLLLGNGIHHDTTVVLACFGRA